MVVANRNYELRITNYELKTIETDRQIENIGEAPRTPHSVPRTINHYLKNFINFTNFTNYNMKTHNLIIGAMALALSFGATAQTFPLEFDASIGYGLSTFRYKNAIGETTMGYGPNFAFNYHILLTNRFSIRTGVGVDLLRAGLRADRIEGKSENYYLSGNNYPFVFSYTYENYKEDLRSALLNVPLILRYEFPGIRTSSPNNARIVPHIGVGITFGLPVVSSYKSSGTLNTQGEFTDPPIPGNPNVIITDVERHGFVSNYPFERKGRMDLKVATASASFSIGARYSIPGKSSMLFFSLYCDIGLNDISKAPNAHALEWNDGSPETFKYRPVANSSSTEKLCPLTAGIRVTYAFKLAEKQRHPFSECSSRVDYTFKLEEK